MDLKEPLRIGDANLEMQSHTESAPLAAEAAVEELVSSLNQQKLYREVTIALRTGLRDGRADFSFLRVRGLRCLLKFLRSVAESDSTIQLFCDSQSVPELQVVPVLFHHSLREGEEDRVTNLDHIFTVVPMKLTSPSTDIEVALALRVLEGLNEHIGNSGVLERGACLDALIALMSDSTANQMDFETYNGIEEVAALVRDKQMDDNLRMKCGEFLLLLIGHVHGRDTMPMATVHDDVRRLLGEKSASLIWAASQFGTTLDPEERMTALHIQARRVLESLDL